MPKSKRSAKRRKKLKKRGNKTYNWAARKVMKLTPEELEQLIKNAQVEMERIEESTEDERLQERIENRIDKRFEEEDDLQG